MPLPVLALTAAHQEALSALAKREGLVAADDPAALGRAVRAMSDWYNARGDKRPSPRDELAARLGFWFARDVQKGSLAVAELLAAGLVGPEARVLDIGAGLGAMTWGIAHAMHAVHGRADLRATWLDADERALELAGKLRSAWPAPSGVSVRATTETSDASRLPRGTFDLVVLGQVLSEMDRDLDEGGRIAHHVAWITDLMRTRVSPKGSLVIVEPALLVRSRHLHAIRDGLLASDAAHVFAPCVHEAPCPALAAPREWCHEDREVSLPEWLVPVARAAGLRFEGLTWSYLVLRHDAANVRDRFPGACARTVSNVLRSKGKEELVVCGPSASATATLTKLYRIDREKTETNAAWNDLGRGMLVSRTEKNRIGKEETLTTLDPSVVPPREGT